MAVHQLVLPQSTNNTNTIIAKPSFWTYLGFMLCGAFLFAGGLLYGTFLHQSQPMPMTQTAQQQEAPAASQNPPHLSKKNKKATPVVPPRYTIQLGAFVSQKNAQDMVQRMQAQGIVCQIATKKDNGVTTFYVRYGAYFSFQEAFDVANTVFSAKNICAVIMPLGPKPK